MNAEQMAVVARIRAGESLALTGAAGTGKSTAIRAAIATMPGDAVALTATTGAAAVQLGAGLGRGRHDAARVAGVGLAREPAEELARKILAKPFGPAAKRWRRTALLVVDEVSMLSAQLLDELETVARLVRRNERPFGGIAVVAVGDFGQLPPVTADDHDGHPGRAGVPGRVLAAAVPPRAGRTCGRCTASGTRRSSRRWRRSAGPTRRRWRPAPPGHWARSWRGWGWRRRPGRSSRCGCSRCAARWRRCDAAGLAALEAAGLAALERLAVVRVPPDARPPAYTGLGRGRCCR